MPKRKAFSATGVSPTESATVRVHTRGDALDYLIAGWHEMEPEVRNEHQVTQDGIRRAGGHRYFSLSFPFY